MEQQRTYKMTLQQVSLKEKIVTHISQNAERQSLPTLRQLQSKPVKDLLNDANVVIRTIPTNTLEETNQLAYSTVSIVTMELAYKLQKLPENSLHPKMENSSGKKNKQIMCRH